MADAPLTLKATQGTYASSEKPSTSLYTAAKTFPKVMGNVHQTFMYTNLPARLAGRQVISAKLYVTMGWDGGVGSRTVVVQRHAKPASSTYAAMTWNNRPGALPGSTAVPLTQAIANQNWVFDVTADLQAIALGEAYYGWRITTTYTAHSWAVYGASSALPVRLVVELGDYPATPVGLGPAGVTALAAPTFTWLAPSGLLSAQLQIDEVGGDFSSPLWDSGVVGSLTSAQLNSAALGWSGQAVGSSVIARVRQTTDMGTSPWSLPITVIREALPALVITSPAADTTDPTPGVVWEAAGQSRWQVTISSGLKTLYDTGVRPGDDTAFAPPTGATRAGQVLTVRVRSWNDEPRTASPGDPGYAEALTETTYNPGPVTAVSTLVVNQDGENPWNDLEWTRGAGLPDEWLISRDDIHIARIPAIVDGDPVWTWRDWTCPPNHDVTYSVRAMVAGAAGSEGPLAAFRSEVGGAWLVDPETGANFSISGDSLSLAYAESTVSYETVGGDRKVKRTFALRGLEGTVGGTLARFAGRSVEDQEQDLYAIKARPSEVFRYVCGDVNIPVQVSGLSSVADPERGFTDRVIKQVTYTIDQVGELPFPAVAP